MLTAVALLLVCPYQKTTKGYITGMFDNNWDVLPEVRSIGGQLNEGMLTLSQQEHDEAP